MTDNLTNCWNPNHITVRDFNHSIRLKIDECLIRMNDFPTLKQEIMNEICRLFEQPQTAADFDLLILGSKMGCKTLPHNSEQCTESYYYKCKNPNCKTHTTPERNA